MVFSMDSAEGELRAGEADWSGAKAWPSVLRLQNRLGTNGILGAIIRSRPPASSA